MVQNIQYIGMIDFRIASHLLSGKQFYRLITVFANVYMVFVRVKCTK